MHVPLDWYTVDAKDNNGGASFDSICNAGECVSEAHIRLRIADRGLRIGERSCNPKSAIRNPQFSP
jgi:hypothetical protein